MARPSIENIRGIGDFATLVNWNVTFIRAPLAAPLNMAYEEFNIRCESSDVPKSTGQTTEIMIRGHKVRQPGIYTPQGTLNLVMVESVDNKISNFIRNWREACWQTRTGVQQTKERVEAIMRLTRLNRQDNGIWQYDIYGAFLEDYDPTGGQLQGQSADIVRPTLTLSYDYFDDRPLGAGTGFNPNN